MELRAVEYFAAVAERGTVRGAAAQLGISQPALTKAIRRLEDEVGVVLFDRQPRGVTLTVYGRTLLRHARNVQASLKEAHQEIAALRAGIAGRIRIGAGPSWERAVLPQAITQFIAANRASRSRCWAAPMTPSRRSSGRAISISCWRRPRMRHSSSPTSNGAH